MPALESVLVPDRRRFLQRLGATSTVFLLWPGLSFGESAKSKPAPLSNDIEYKCRTVSLSHLSELKVLMERLNAKGRLSQQKRFQGYLKDLQYEAPKEMPEARSIVLAATPWQLRSVTFRWQGKDHVILIPGGYFYYGDDTFIAALKQRLAQDVLQHPGAALVAANPPLKTLAAHSGLAQYGKNNVAYVDQYGSFHVLWAFFSTQELPDQWQAPLRLMRFCKGCSICARACPSNALAGPTFLLNAERCITLYNELKDPLPGWVDRKAHNALIGCLKCQYGCPANQELIHNLEDCAHITEQETAMLLSGQRDPRLEASISEKLKGLGDWYAKDMAYLSRNLKLVLANSSSIEALA
jgi:epoxyqueuosine reductase